MIVFRRKPYSENGLRRERSSQRLSRSIRGASMIFGQWNNHYRLYCIVEERR